MNWFDELEDGAKLVVVGTVAIAGTVVLWKGITTAEKVSKDISEKKYQAMLPPEYFKLKEAEENNASKERIAKIEAETKMDLAKSEHRFAEKALSEHTWQNIRNVGALTTTANHAINAFANASREVRLHGNN